MAAVNIKVRRQSFTIDCAADEAAAMRYAATVVEKKIEEVQKQTGVADGERIAIMAALMLAHDNGTAGSVGSTFSADNKKLIDKMNNNMDAALMRTEPPRGRVIT